MIPSLNDILLGLFIWATLLATAISAFPVLGALYERIAHALGYRL